MFISFGVYTVLLWLLVDDGPSIIIYLLYVCSYTAVLLCQVRRRHLLYLALLTSTWLTFTSKFHRCFTKSHRLHVMTVLGCCLVGFVLGCLLRALPATKTFFYDYAIAQVTATVSAAIGTGVLTRSFPRLHARSEPSPEQHSVDQSRTVAEDEQRHKHDRLPCYVVHDAHRKILHHLTMGLDPNAAWQSMEEDVRRVVVQRVLCRAVRITQAVRNWSLDQPTAIAEHDKSLRDPSSYSLIDSSPAAGVPFKSNTNRPNPGTHSFGHMFKVFMWPMQAMDLAVQWTALISGASPEVPRELWYDAVDNILGV